VRTVQAVHQWCLRSRAVDQWAWLFRVPPEGTTCPAGPPAGQRASGRAGTAPSTPRTETDRPMPRIVVPSMSRDFESPSG
jgi:hypothetical protein